MSVAETDEVPSFIRRGNPYAPPSHPDRQESFAELARALVAEMPLAEMARALEDIRINAGARREQIARLISELPVHEAAEMALQIVGCAVDDVAKPDLAMMLQLNAWARFVLTGEKNAASES